MINEVDKIKELINTYNNIVKPFIDLKLKIIFTSPVKYIIINKDNSIEEIYPDYINKQLKTIDDIILMIQKECLNYDKRI